MTKKKKKTYGAVSLGLGILSLLLVFMPYLGLPLAILAVVFAGTSSKKKEHSANATGGKVCGIISIVINAIMMLFVLAILAMI
jgi:hypothetical protein